MRVKDLRMLESTTSSRCLILDQIATPVWVYSPKQGRILWANSAALVVWKADTAEGLGKRNLAPISPAIKRRLEHYLMLFQHGEEVWESWTFFPRDEPTTLFCRCSGIDWLGEAAILFEAHPHELQNTRRGENFTRAMGMLQDMPVVLTLLLVDGTPVFQNLAADMTFGTLDRTPFFDRFTERHEMESMITTAWDQGEAPINLMAVNTRADVAWFQFGAQRTRDPSTGAPAVLVYGFDVTEQELMKDISQSAYSDV